LSGRCKMKVTTDRLHNNARNSYMAPIWYQVEGGFNLLTHR